MRKHKILLTLNDQEYKRLFDLKTSLQTTSERKVSFSDVLRRALFSLPLQGVLW